MRKLISGYWMMSFLLGAASLSSAASHQVQATLVADRSSIKAGEPFQVGVLLKIEPDWHVYWINPGDAGIPTTVTFKLPAGFSASPLQYPLPERLVQPGNIVAYGYEDEVMFVTTITPPSQINESTVTIEADANWLVCEKVCIPGNAKLNLTLAVAETAKPDHQELFGKWLHLMPTTQDISSNSSSIVGNQLTISIQWKEAAPADLQWFPPASSAVLFSDIRIETKDRMTKIMAKTETLSGQSIETEPIESLLKYKISQETRGVIVPVDLKSPVRK